MAMARAGVNIKQKHSTLRRGRFMVFSSVQPTEMKAFNSLEACEVPRFSVRLEPPFGVGIAGETLSAD